MTCNPPVRYYAFIVLLTIMIITLSVTLAISAYYVSYWIYSMRHQYKINKLLKTNTIKPIESIMNIEWLDKPISQFYINSSHNSYLSFFQHGSIVSPSNVEQVLKMGARSIELDVSGILPYPIVAHGSSKFITTSYIKLSTMLDTIVDHGFKTSDPLFLNLEILDSENDDNVKQVRDLLVQKFGQRLFNYDHYKNKSGQKNFMLEPFRALLNKVIILNTTHKLLDDLTDNVSSKIDGKTTTFYTSDNTSSIALKGKTITTDVTRIYLTGSVQSYLSMNIDPIPQWKLKNNMVALNFQMKDNNLYNNLNFFKDYSFRYMEDPEVLKFFEKV